MPRRSPGATARQRSARRLRRRSLLAASAMMATTATCQPLVERSLSQRNDFDFIWSLVDTFSTDSATTDIPFTDGSGDFGRVTPLPSRLKDPSMVGFQDPILDNIAKLPEVQRLAQLLSDVDGHPSPAQGPPLESVASSATAATTFFLERHFGVHRNPHDISDLHSTLLQAFLSYTNDPDIDFVYTASTTGSPVGLDPSCPIPSSHGLFPPSSTDKYNGWPQDDSIPYVGDNLVANYSSVTTQRSIVESMYTAEVHRGWMEPLQPTDSFWQVKVAIIAKKELDLMPTDPTSLPVDTLCKYYRLIEDYRRNGLNQNLLLNETIRLPSYRQLVYILTKLSAASRLSHVPLAAANADIASAFRNCPVRPEERHFLTVALQDASQNTVQLYRHTRLPFGLASSPYLWVRLYSAVHRSCQALFRGLGYGLSYIDDLLWILPASSIHLCFAIILSIQSSLGLPFSWHKLCLRQGFSFIGFDVALRQWSDWTSFDLFVPAAKRTRALRDISSLSTSGHISLKPLESLIGRLLFTTQTNVVARHNLSPLFAVLQTLRRKRTRRGSLLRWVTPGEATQSCLSYWQAWLQRSIHHSIVPPRPVSGRMTYALLSDASTDFVGALLVTSDRTGHFGRISVTDLFAAWPQLRLYSSVPANMVILELTGLALALYLLHSCSTPAGLPGISLSDNESAVKLVHKGFSTKPIIGSLLGTIINAAPALLRFQFIPGSVNVVADNVSRGVDPMGPWTLQQVKASDFVAWCHSVSL